MTTGILAKLGLTSWGQAYAWVRNRRYPCEECMKYKRFRRCRYYGVCKGMGKENAIVFFTRKESQPYRPDPRHGSVSGEKEK